jgi:hypothetical protein
MRSCSYCCSVEHDRRKCSYYQEDLAILYDITSLYINIVLDSLVHYGIGPTALLSVSDSSFHFYKNNPDASFVWSKIDSEIPELFVVDKIRMLEVCPFAIPLNTSYNTRGEYHITMSHLETASLNMLVGSSKLPSYAMVNRNMRSWLWSIPSESLRDSLQGLETVLWRESRGTSRQSFTKLLETARRNLEKFRYEKKYFDIMKDAVVLSGIPTETLKKYYEFKKQKIIKTSLDKTMKTWYKYYSKKIKHNHF